MLTEAEKKWKAEAYWPVLRWTRPRLYEMIHSKGPRYNAFLRHAMAAM
jgi:hypothetical protein